jgi:hypothetical protein
MLRHIVSSVSGASSSTAPMEPVGTATIIFRGVLFLADLAAASIVYPDASPSSTSMTTLSLRLGFYRKPKRFGVYSKINDLKVLMLEKNRICMVGNDDSGPEDALDDLDLECE